MKKEYSQKGSCYADFCLAVKRDFRREGRPEADFIWCRAFGREAEYLCSHCRKGNRISLKGKLEAGRSFNEDGTPSYYSRVLADKLWVTDYKKEEDPSEGRTPFDPQMDPERFAGVPDGTGLPFAGYS